jgi:hydroxyacylglutathione hydrolase
MLSLSLSLSLNSPVYDLSFTFRLAGCGIAEYTVKNLQFALSVEPKNADAERKILWSQDARAKGEATVPSTIGEELAHNPFMRIREETVRQHVGGGTDDADVMRKLRNFKDTFAGSSRPWIPGGGPLPGL